MLGTTVAAHQQETPSTVGALQKNPLSAEASDPRVMGWMQGFPPPRDKRIMQPESDYFSFPKLRWSVCHIRQLLPTIQISRGLEPAVPLRYLSAPELERTAREIDALTFTPLNSSQTMTWKQSLSANYTDGMLIIHKGRVVYEHYSGCLDQAGKHAAMSMTKSLTGLLAEIMVAEGKLDPSAPVTRYVPEVANSAFGTATVREVMDMTTGLDYSEDYSDPNAGVWKYSTAASPLPKPTGYTGPVGYYEFLEQIQAQGRNGDAFHYRTPNADMVGWLVSRVSNKSIPELASERLWRPMGAEQDAYMTVDSLGTAFAGGGLSASLRDVGRIGLLVLNEGVINGKRLFPAKAVQQLRAGGDPKKFGTEYQALIGGSYTGLWWIYPGANRVVAARGVYGQTIYVDWGSDMVLVRFASMPNAANSLNDPTSLPAYRAVSAYLKSK
ncbi:beta-lactamase family protein [Sphingomonas sp. IC-56]|uniref:serine hydrolase domain-containing protein n=1 Tax=Sphingomonas sp. IC-56 TaxID=2898529 RepID=UPI001E54B36E|nr:serine hydrolase [Sphingomonas sp. IC-56]MCD2324424.1 beta-lactamase family protein [Sphingomonas sp. IC-56]